MPRKRDTHTYKMVDDKGRTQKYGITNDLVRREAENRSDGHGNRIVPMSGARTRPSDKSRETELIDKYQQQRGHNPPGNKIR